METHTDIRGAGPAVASTPTLAEPLAIGTLTVRNRLYRAPVLEGAGAADDPAAVYARHFVPNAEAGVGLIVQGNTIVLPEGRTSPGMSAIAGRDDVLALAPMTRAVRAAGAEIVIQLGHGGAFALEAWHREVRARRSTPPLAPSRPPLFLRAVQGRVHVPSTREVEALVDRFGVVGAWAREAGYSGVQLAGANAKLLHQFLSPLYNRRRDRFGGSTEGRARLLVDIREAIAREAGRDFPVLLKFPAREIGPGARLRLEEGVLLARRFEDAGFAALTPVETSTLPNTALCRGGFPGASFQNPALRKRLQNALGGRIRYLFAREAMRRAARKHPFRACWNRDVFRAVKRAVSVPVFAVGGIRTPAEASAILAAGEADLIGIGRPFYAEPDLARRFLARAASGPTPFAPFAPLACESCNRCVVPQMLGLPGVCYNPASQTAPVR